MIILDVEATGTNAILHSVLSLGAIDFDRPERRFYLECQMWEGAHIMEGALAVNGFSESEARDSAKMTEAELITQFMEWTQEMSDRTLVGQNVSFDRAYVMNACARARIACDLPYRTLDTHTMCYMHMLKAGLVPGIDPQHRRSNLNLNAVLNYCGIPSEPDPHNALTGALCHAEVASRLLYDRALLPEFAAYSIPWH
jgi:DNA polymerase III epsilon subunit-like protein